MIIARVPLIAADILLIYITWTMLKGRAALTHFQQSKRLTLSDVLFRGGMSFLIPSSRPVELTVPPSPQESYILCASCDDIVYGISHRCSNAEISILFILNVLHLVLTAAPVIESRRSSRQSISDDTLTGGD